MKKLVLCKDEVVKLKFWEEVLFIILDFLRLQTAARLEMFMIYVKQFFLHVGTGPNLLNMRWFDNVSVESIVTKRLIIYFFSSYSLWSLTSMLNWGIWWKNSTIDWLWTHDRFLLAMLRGLKLWNVLRRCSDFTHIFYQLIIFELII